MRIVSLVALVCFGLGLGSSALAYNNYDNPACDWPYSAGGSNPLYVPFKNATGGNAPTGDYATALSAARTSWLYSDTPASFAWTGGTGSIHAIDSWVSFDLGLLYPNCSGGNMVAPTLFLNTYQLGNTSTYGDPTPYPEKPIFWKQFTAAHEQGHNIGLGHSSVNPALMIASISHSWYDNNPFAFNGPMADDECGVNNVYVSTSWPATCGY